LAPAELYRAAKFKFETDRRKYVLSHAALRHILAFYCKVDSLSLEFSVGPYGKPAIGSSPANQVKFNLSHSAEAALVALAPDRELGVDIEYIQPKLECHEIATRFFATGEIEKIRLLAPDEQRRAFFTCWTRKEAYIKAKGGGLSIPLQDFEVSLAPDEKPALLWHRTEPEEPARWQFENLDLVPAYAAAVAIEGSGCNVKYFRWPDDLPKVE
jgi:4'-phosphopantetheinyl transferase